MNLCIQIQSKSISEDRSTKWGNLPASQNTTTTYPNSVYSSGSFVRPFNPSNLLKGICRLAIQLLSVSHWEDNVIALLLGLIIGIVYYIWNNL